MGAELRKFRAYPSRSEETLNFTAEVWLDGVRVGRADNDGRGGSCRVDWESPAARERFVAHARALPAVESDSGPLAMDADFLLQTLAEEAQARVEAERRDRRLARYAMDARVRGLHAYEGTFEAGGARYEVLLALPAPDEAAALAQVRRAAGRRAGASGFSVRLLEVRP